MSIDDIHRELTPFEHLVMGFLCDGLTNKAIADHTGHTIKSILNTVYRVGRLLEIHESESVNSRVALAMAYRQMATKENFFYKVG